ncbi:hypothetical protein BH23CHL5_BH23CHL5_13620 [soil metagenome]
MTESRNEQPGASAYPANQSVEPFLVAISSGRLMVESNASEFVERFQAGLLGALDLLSVVLGDQLDYYRSMAMDGPATSTELADRIGASERYMRERLEQQAATGILVCENPDMDLLERDCVTFRLRDAGDAYLVGRYDFAIAIECIHDMPNAVEVLAAMRQMVGEGGTVLVVDERAEPVFTPIGSDQERILYGFSLLLCLPVGMADKPTLATGAVMRPQTFQSYTADEGFQSVEILPIEHDGFYFDRLTA